MADRTSTRSLCTVFAEAKAALLVALQRYEGTVILVSHDAEFVSELEPTRAIVMPEGDADYFDTSMLELVALA